MAEASGREMVIYQDPGGEIRVDVRLEHETVWLSLGQLAELFGRDKSVISRHLRNVFASRTGADGNRCKKCNGSTGGRPGSSCDHVARIDRRVRAGFSYPALTRMVRFAEWMTDERILATLSRELSWSHFMELLPIKEPLAREFYAEIEPVPTDSGGRKAEPELDRLSNILKSFNEQFGTLFTDTDRVAKRIRDDIAPQVAADAAYRKAQIGYLRFTK
jgi:DUF1016 N-terminal domain